MTSTWTEKSLEDLADKLVLAQGRGPAADGQGRVTESWGRAVFLIGAGCSVTAGIPPGAEVARRCACHLARTYESHDRADGAAGRSFGDPAEALAWLVDNRRVQDRKTATGEPDWSWYYTEFFDNHLTSVNRQREFFDAIIRDAEDKLNWAHVCLGELVSRRYVHTVLTTNFDQLVLQGVIRTGLLPVVADGIESLNRVTAEPKRPQIVHLHGSMHTYNPRNSRAAIMATRQDPTLRSMLYTILHRCDLLVVVGYAGGEEGIMDLLLEAARQLPPLMIFWTLRDQSSPLSPAAEELMNIGDNKFVVRGSDADTVFQTLMNRLRIGEPAWMKDPIETLSQQAKKLAGASHPEVVKAFTRFRSRVEYAEGKGRREESDLDEVEALRLAGRYREVLSKLAGMDDAAFSTDLRTVRATTNFNLAQEVGDDADGLNMAIDDFTQLARQAEGEAKLEFHRRLFEALMLSYDDFEDKRALTRIIEAFEGASDLYETVEDRETIAVRLLVAKAYQQRGEAYQQQGEADKSAADLAHAEKEFRTVLAAIDTLARDNRWAETKEGLATTLQMQGAEESAEAGPALGQLNEAYDHLRDLLLLNLDARSLDQAGRLRNLAGTILTRAEKDASTRLSLLDAQIYLTQAIEIYETQFEDIGDAVEQTNAELKAVRSRLSA